MTDHISGFPTLQGALCVVPDSEMTSSFVKAKVFSPVLKTFGAARSDKEREKKQAHLSNVNGEKMKMYGIIKQL